MKKVKVAVILAGCGYLDGAEIRESVLSLLALDNAGVQYNIFALDIDQHHVVDHLTGDTVEGAKRNVLQESARIARGDIQALSMLETGDFDALLMPGGFGVAKNMSTFAFEGSSAKLVDEVANVVKEFYDNKKPIGAICISPVIVALALGSQHPVLTIGNDTDTATELEKLGVKHVNCKTDSCIVDEANKIVTTPAYMDGDANISDVYIGISKLVNQLIDLV